MIQVHNKKVSSEMNRNYPPDRFLGSLVGIIGSAAAGGGSFKDVVGKIAEPLKKAFSGLFGDGISNEVRWLAQIYEFYVLGNPSATSRTKANPALAPDAQAWFSAVLGVPIYDRLRLTALMGWDVNTAAYIPGITDAQKVNNYKNMGTDTMDVPIEAIVKAVEIAKQFKFYPQTPGSWAKFGVVASPLPGLDAGGTGSIGGTGSGQTGSIKTTGSPLAGSVDRFAGIPISTILIGGGVLIVVILLIVVLTRKK
jgi:hypothetical protein